MTAAERRGMQEALYDAILPLTAALAERSNYAEENQRFGDRSVFVSDNGDRADSALWLMEIASSVIAQRKLQQCLRNEFHTKENQSASVQCATLKKLLLCCRCCKWIENHRKRPKCAPGPKIVQFSP